MFNTVNPNSPNQTLGDNSEAYSAGGNIVNNTTMVSNGNPKEIPIIIYEQEIKELILGMKEVIKLAKTVNGISTDFERGENFMEKKNSLNNLPKDHYNFYKEKLICSNDISNFLSDPKNNDITEIYFTISDEITQSYQTRKSKDSTTTIEEVFNEVFNKVANTLGNDRNKIWYLISHMYFSCDIGIK